MAVHELKLPTWYRVLAIVVGVMSIVLALIVLVFPVLAVWLLIYILAFALLMIGMDRLVAGITGHPFGPMMVTAGMVGTASDASKSTGSTTGQGAPPKP